MRRGELGRRTLMAGQTGKAVLFLESSPNIGGQELQLLQQMQELQKLGFTVRLLCKPSSRIADFARQKGLDTAPIAFRNALHLPSILGVRQHIHDLQARAIIVHSGHDAIVGALAAKSCRLLRPAIIRMRTYQHKPPQAFPYQYLFDRTLACSAYLRSQILANPKISPDKVGVLYPGIDFSQFEVSAEQGSVPTHVKEWLTHHPGPLMLHGAMLRAEKGHRSIIEAMPAILQSQPDLRYVIAGEGHLRDELAALVEHMGLEEHVFLAGMINPLSPLLRQAQLAILPSLVEPLGMFQIESIDQGIPTIAAKVGGIPETIQHQRSGLLVSPGDVVAWVDAIKWALANLETMRDWAQTGKAANRIRFGIETNTRQLIDEIEDLYVSRHG